LTSLIYVTNNAVGTAPDTPSLILRPNQLRISGLEAL
jgi:hypothetical protein